MVVRALKHLVLIVFLGVLGGAPSQACFGPKLFFGVGPGEEQDVLFALVTLYVQEKTGVQSVRVAIDEGRSPLDLITADQADLVFLSAPGDATDTVFVLEGLAALAAGSRPREDLQFTTVLPAIGKLNGLLTPAMVKPLIGRVAAGESAMAVARDFLMERRWI